MTNRELMINLLIDGLEDLPMEKRVELMEKMFF